MLRTRELRRTKQFGGHYVGMVVWLQGEGVRVKLSLKLQFPKAPVFVLEPSSQLTACVLVFYLVGSVSGLSAVHNTSQKITTQSV